MENTVEVVVATDADFACFDEFITKQEALGIGRNDGVFKIVLDPKERITPASEALTAVLHSLKSVQRQKLINNGLTDGIYTYKKSSASKRVTDKFKAEASHLASFENETCCSRKLDSGGITALLEHFFEDVVSSAAERNPACVDLEKRKRDLLCKGEKLRHLYYSGKDLFERKKTESGCSCTVCDDDSGLGSDSDDDATSKKVLEPGIMLYAPAVILDAEAKPIFITKNLCMSKLKNILALSKHHYDGLSCPGYYIGKEHSFFPLHGEDVSLWSFNFLHLGRRKIWIVIPPRAILLLKFHLMRSNLSLGNTSCWNFVGHKTCFPTPKWLTKRGIPFKVVVQEENEGVIVYPNAIHFGWNEGWNFSEAINFGTVSWIPDGINSQKCQCLPGQIHFDMSELVAAFREDLLDQYMCGYIPTESDYEKACYLATAMKDLCLSDVTVTAPCSSIQQHSQGEHHSEEEAETCEKQDGKTKSGPTLLQSCPVPHCNKKYPYDKKSRLIKHVKTQHKPVLEKLDLLNVIEAKHLELRVFKKKLKGEKLAHANSD